MNVDEMDGLPCDRPIDDGGCAGFWEQNTTLGGQPYIRCVHEGLRHAKAALELEPPTSVAQLETLGIQRPRGHEHLRGLGLWYISGRETETCEGCALRIRLAHMWCHRGLALCHRCLVLGRPGAGPDVVAERLAELVAVAWSAAAWRDLVEATRFGQRCLAAVAVADGGKPVPGAASARLVELETVVTECLARATPEDRELITVEATVATWLAWAEALGDAAGEASPRRWEWDPVQARRSGAHPAEVESVIETNRLEEVRGGLATDLVRACATSRSPGPSSTSAASKQAPGSPAPQ